MIRVLTDSTCGMSIEELKKQNVYSMPLQVIKDGTGYRDIEEIEIDTIVSYIQNKELLSTSQPIMQDTIDCFEKMTNDGVTDVICLPLPKTLSGTYNQILLVSQDYNINVHFVDVYTPYKIQANLITLTNKMISEGKQVEEILEKLNAITKSVNTLILVDDINHLIRGGRLSRASGTVADLLKIKPLLEVGYSSEAVINTVAKVRTAKKALAKFIEVLLDSIDESYTVYLVDTNRSEDVKEVEAAIKEKYPNCKIEFGNVNSVFTCHVGDKVIGAQYIKNQN